MSNLVIAIPKGRIMNKVFRLFEEAGYTIKKLEDERQLVVEDEQNGFTYVFVKPSDVCTYVEEGICDIGIVGSDIIQEQDKDIYELFDLDIAKCKMVIAGKKGFKYKNNSLLTVATKYPNITKKYLRDITSKIRIVKLNGSVELGPLIALSDVIVDITETGKTIEANNLEIYDELFEISSRLISNKRSYRTHYNTITTLVERLQNRGEFDVKNNFTK